MKSSVCLISIRRFELDATRTEATVEISAQILSQSGRIIAGRLFSGTVPVASSDAAVVAAAQTMKKHLDDIVTALATPSK